MPTPRSRQIVGNCSGVFDWNTTNGYSLSLYNEMVDGLWTNLAYSQGRCLRNVQAKSVLQDWITDPSEQRRFLPCDHRKTLTAFDHQQMIVNFAAPSPSMTLRWNVPFLADQNYENPSVPWGPLVVELGSLVRDDLQSNAYLLVTLAELVKTYRMVRNPFGLLKGNWRDLVGDKPLKSLVTKASSVWLESRYGWKPLVYDIQNFCDAYVNYVRASNNLGVDQDDLRYSAASTSYVSPSTPYWGESAAAWLKIRKRIVTYMGSSNSVGGWARVEFDPFKVIARVGCRKWLVAQRVKSRMELAMTALNTRPIDLFDTIWELLPYSFVVDWFIDIGGIMGLASAKALLGSTITNQLGYSLKWEQPYRASYIPSDWFWKYRTPYSGYPPVSIMLGSDAPVDGVRKQYVRELGLPYTSIDDFCGTDLSYTHRADSAGLIIQQIMH